MIAAAALAIVALAAQSAPDRAREGDWSVSDQTDNNTGKREVYAFLMHFPEGDPGYLTLTLRCSDDKPTFFLDWSQTTPADKAIVTIGPVASPDAEPTEVDYILTRSNDPTERGLRASAAVTQQIVTAIGSARYATFSVELPTGQRLVGLDVKGTPGAWSRVSKHCPSSRLPLPPL